MAGIASDSLMENKIIPDASKPLLICFSHLRWNFVFQRPQHLMSRYAATHEVLYWEEPLIEAGEVAHLDVSRCARTNVITLTPVLRSGLSPQEEVGELKHLLDEFLVRCTVPDIAWYYTPMMLPFSEHLAARCVVYDCMDELANFKHAPPAILSLERDLIARADLVFTGGYSLYQAKKDRHENTHLFPSAVDVAHFSQPSDTLIPPPDQAELGRPRLGFFGVIDERMDLDLLASVADARPEWSIIMIGPVVKIGLEDLPRRDNIHYLGPKAYAELPAYLAEWDVALMPFAINEATRFISPTKTPEYLAAGKPVVSTPIVDVERQYGTLRAVEIAEGAPAFVEACDRALIISREPEYLRAEIEEALGNISWDSTFKAMTTLVSMTSKSANDFTAVVSPTVWGGERPKPYDVLVVGAGFAGAVMAERLASDGGKRVLVVDKRPHIAGNAFDRIDEAGILIHQYGPHIFHTNSREIVDYLSRFTDWQPYEHRVLAQVDGMLVPIPINRTTLNSLYGCNLQTEDEAARFLADKAEPVEVINTSADVVISAIGREMYEKFFRGYTRKQWGMDPSELDKSVTARIPIRTNTDDRYFTDSFQAMPLNGYTAMFEKILDHSNIDLLLGVEYKDMAAVYPHDHLVFTGPIDEYFGYRFGKLPYRSLRFHHETRDCEFIQPVGVINYPSEDVPYTRATEYKHLTGQKSPFSSITFEFPSAQGDPYYPIPRPENQALFRKYEMLAKATRDVTFVGRLATYRYYNMDQVVGQALATYRKQFLSPLKIRSLASVGQTAVIPTGRHLDEPGNDDRLASLA